MNRAIADVVDAFSELDLARAWGDGATVAADGTQVETFIDNLLAETSIRYGTARSGTWPPAAGPLPSCRPRAATKHLATLGHYVRLGEETSARITADKDPLAR